MQRMSFAMTTQAVKDRTKLITRRCGWSNLKPGDLLMAVDRSARGAKVPPVMLATLRVLSTRWEPLCAVTDEEVVKEGFSGLNREQFVAFFCKKMKCDAMTLVNRIEFEYVEENGDG